MKNRFTLIAGALLLLLALPASPADDSNILYDANGNPVRAAENDGVVIEYVRDRDGALVQARYSDGRVINYDKNGVAHAAEK